MPRITDLPELTNPSDDDILVIDDNPASGTTTKKVTKGNLTKDLARKADLDAHTADTDNPHQVTAEQLGIEPGATANATDAELRDRSTHTGFQAIATVTGLQAALIGKVNLADLPDALTDLDTEVTGDQLDALKAVVDTITSGMVNGVYINGPSIGELKYIDFSTDNLAESIGFTFRVEDVLKAAFSLYTGNNDFFLDAYNDAGEKILMFAANAQARKFVVTPYLADGKLGINTYDPSEALDVVGNIAVSGTVDGRDVTADGTKLDDIDEHATANDTDEHLRDRSTHTGTQPASSISDFTTAADARIAAQKGQNNGIATLDSSGKVPSVQLPSFVDDVVEYANTGAFPGTGETAKIYVALDTGKVYRWGGSSFIEISPSPGSTDAVPEGATNLYYPAADKAKLAGVEAGAQVNDVSSADIADFETTTELNARDTANRNRVNHTGTQAQSTITNLTTDLAAKAPLASPAFTGTPTGITKAHVGLGNVDNTSDANKPISSATQTALNKKQAKVFVTIGPSGSGADYETDGTADQAQFISAITAVNSAGGGKILVKAGVYHFSDQAFVNGASNITIEGEHYGAVIIEVDYQPSTSHTATAAIDFRSSSSTPVGNITIRNLWFDHNQNSTNAILFRGTSTGTNASQGFFVERCEFYGRKGDSGTGEANILCYGVSTGTTGTITNIHFKDCVFRDDYAPLTNLNHSNIRFASNDIENVTIEGCRFVDTYGNTIAFSASGTARQRKSVTIRNNRFIRTKLGTFSTSVADIMDSARLGFTGISVTDNYFNDEGAYAVTEDKFHMAIYNSYGFTVSGNRFMYSRSILAPGHSFSTGNESTGWTFSNNVVYESKSFLDSDGHIAGTYTGNVFVRVDIGRVFWGYGNHKGSMFSDNVLYDCGANPLDANEYNLGLVQLQSGGNVIQNNLFYTRNVQPKYIFYEGSDGTNYLVEPNIYDGNKIMGLGAAMATFALNPDFDHIITNNVGVTESTIQNLVATGTVGTLSTTALSASDVVNGNWTLGGARVADNRSQEIATKTANYTLTATDSIILADASSGAITMTLPSAAGIAGRQYTIKRVNSGANAVGIATTSSQTIDGATTMSMTTQWQSVTVVSNGANWLVL